MYPLWIAGGLYFWWHWERKWQYLTDGLRSVGGELALLIRTYAN
ncbi:hypothetical protein CBM2585_B110057 [Cupriavidus taiwanensis]|nr:hypothetical protein CBM2585_B110057 [Cupriavidus taiwanensis]